jgi:hypothetical protein
LVLHLAPRPRRRQGKFNAHVIGLQHAGMLQAYDADVGRADDLNTRMAPICGFAGSP